MSDYCVKCQHDQSRMLGTALIAERCSSVLCLSGRRETAGSAELYCDECVAGYNICPGCGTTMGVPSFKVTLVTVVATVLALGLFAGLYALLVLS